MQRGRRPLAVNGGAAGTEPRHLPPRTPSLSSVHVRGAPGKQRVLGKIKNIRVYHKRIPFVGTQI